MPRHVVSLSKIAVVVETMPTSFLRMQTAAGLPAPAMRAKRLG